jgi:hypothetical protein
VRDVERDGMNDSERIDKICSDVAVMSAMFGEMSKRLDEQSKCILTLNHNSTEVQVCIARLEGVAERNKLLIEGFKNDLMNSVKIWLTVFGVAVSIITFALNYFKI